MIPAVDQSRFHGVKPEDVLMKFVRTVDLTRCERDLDFPAAAYYCKQMVNNKVEESSDQHFKHENTCETFLIRK